MKPLLIIAALAGTAWLPGVRAEACVNGESAGYACSHVEFLGHLSPAEMNGSREGLNDIWGWVDPLNGDEYAIIGMYDGTAFVRINNGTDLEFLGRLAASDGGSDLHKPQSGRLADKSCHDDACGSNSAWRDIKVYDHYAYIVSEAEGHGVQVFDLHALRTVSDVPQDFLADVSQPYYAYYDGIGHAHNLFINEETARAYIVGHDGNGRAGGLHVLSLTDPMNPAFIGEVDGDGYTHDVQCVVYSGPDSDIAMDQEICFASNEDSITIWNVTEAANPVMLSRTTYPGSDYTHQGWLSDDQRHFFLNDEQDERYGGTRTHLRVFDVTDLSAPTLAAHYFAPTLAIDHNNYVHGRWLYQSNYEAGLRVLDVLDPLHPVEAAYFDPQPTDDVTFHGTWSNYLFPSGVAAFSDISDGLFVVRATLDEVVAPDLTVSLSLAASETDVNESIDGELTLSTGATADANDTLLTLHLPAGAVFTSVNAPAGWTCESISEGRVQECRSAVVGASVEQVFNISVRPSEAGVAHVIAMAYANAADAAPADNLAAAVLRVKGGGGAGAWLLMLAAVAIRTGARRRTC